MNNTITKGNRRTPRNIYIYPPVVKSCLDGNCAGCTNEGRSSCYFQGKVIRTLTRSGNFPGRFKNLVTSNIKQILIYDERNRDSGEKAEIGDLTMENCPINVDNLQAFCGQCIHNATCARAEEVAKERSYKVNKIMYKGLLDAQHVWKKNLIEENK